MQRPRRQPRINRIRTRVRRVGVGARVCAFAGSFAGILSSTSAWAIDGGQVPDAGALMRGTQQLQDYYAPPPELPTQPKPQFRSKEGQQTFTVKRFRIVGAHLVPTRDIQAVLEPWLDREITFADLEDAVQAVADLYQQRGWYARPQLPEQDLVDGVVTIDIIEGKLGDVKVDNSAETRISDNRIIKTLTARQDIGEPLSLDKIDRAVSILNDTPGLKVTTAMSTGAQPETTDIVAKVEPTRWWGLNASVDNFGARSTGYGRLSVNGNADNPLGIGDQITANYVGSLGTEFGRIGYTLPIGYDGLRAGINYSALSYHTIDSFGYPVKQFGTAQIGELVATYPLWRTARDTVTTGLTLDHKRYYNASENISGADLSNSSSNSQSGLIVPTADKNIIVGTWSFNGTHFDSFYGGGATYWNSSFINGNLDLSSAPAVAVAADQAGLNASGNYTKYTGGISRLQQLTDTSTLWLSYSGQLASKNLDSSEYFSLGGPQGVRAYPSYEAQGDQGWLGTIEGRRNFGDNWQAQAFFDAGRIMVNKFAWEGSTQPNLYNLYGAGLGASYTLPGQIVGKAVVAHRIGSNPGANPTNGADNDGTHLPWRFWLSLSGTL